MATRTRTVLYAGILIGALVVGTAVLWWARTAPEARVRRTVMTTIQSEAPASFLVTGTLELHVTVQIDSSAYLTPDWLTFVLDQAQPGLLALLQGRAQTQVRVPGRVSYGFDVRALEPEMIRVQEAGVVAVDLPALSVHSIEPSLERLRVRSSTEGWMQVFSSRVPSAVREQALGGVREAFRAQAQARLQSATQPKVNTARALKAMLTPPLRAAGLDSPQFRIRVGDQLSLPPEATEPENFQN
jgi:hypothetical protein